QNTRRRASAQPRNAAAGLEEAPLGHQQSHERPHERPERQRQERGVQDAAHDIEIVGYTRGGHRLTPFRQSRGPARVESGPRAPIIRRFATTRCPSSFAPRWGAVYARFMLRRAMSVLLVSIVLAGCASTNLSFPNATPGNPLAVPAWELRPEGAGPFPAVVLMHGCAGISESNHEWSRWFRDKGYVALLVDSWAPRHMGTSCAPSLPDIANTERFDDAMG